MSLSCESGSDRLKQLLQNEEVNGIDYVETKIVDGAFIVCLHLLQPLENTLGRHASDPPQTATECDGVEVEINGFKKCLITTKSIAVFDNRQNIFLEATNPEYAADRDSQRIVFRLPNARVGRSYQLNLVALDQRGLRTNYALTGFDPRHAEAEFSFFENQPTTLVDPQPVKVSAKPTRPEPEINYLAKDYQSFRKLILDRLAKTMPDWQERHAADIGMTIVELLAYTGDQLSYFQDAVATELYLETARQRISVRRHARLVDYQIHEGADALGLVQLQVADDIALDPKQVYFITRPDQHFQLQGTVLSQFDLPDELFSSIEVFEPIAEMTQDWRVDEKDVKDWSAILFGGQASKIVDLVVKGLDEVTKMTLPGRDAAGVTELSSVKRLSEVTQKALIQGLNKILRDEDLAYILQYDTRYRQDILLLQEQHHCSSQAILNRAILDLVYARELSPAKFSDKIKCYANHNEIHFYTWGEEECWLSKGATSATLHDAANSGNWRCPSTNETKTTSSKRDLFRLSRGDILLLEEVKGPQTGESGDADPHHRQAVRLEEVKYSEDPVTGDPVVEIRWREEDALRFPLCIASRTNPSGFQLGEGCNLVSNVSVARGNMVLVDHGRTIFNEDIGSPAGNWKQIDCGSVWNEPRWVQDREMFEPVLKEPDMTAERSRTDFCAVSDLLTEQPYKAVPSIRLLGFPAVPVSGKLIPINRSDLQNTQSLMQRIKGWHRNPDQVHLAHAFEDLLRPDTASLLNETLEGPEAYVPNVKLEKEVQEQLRELVKWSPKNDLIDSGPDDRHFVIEMDNQRRAHLRFGDEEHGNRPLIGTRFEATYRVGNGLAGNVGAESINKMVTRDGQGTAVIEVRNPLPTEGGVDPESIREVKIHAPHQYRKKQKRAILASDYEEIVMRNFGRHLQAAHARVTQRGTHWQVDLVIDPLAHVKSFQELQKAIRDDLFKYRRIQHLVRVTRGTNVPIDLKLKVDLHPSALRSEIFRELSDLFSNRDYGEAGRGLFHPDRLTFGDPVYVSQLLSAATRVAGIVNVQITNLSRLGGQNVAGATGPNSSGTNVLEMGPLEIAQLDNQGTEQSGKLDIELEGGK